MVVMMIPMPAPPVTRLAPSPTGALHLGNARTFLINWALARQRGWRIVLRIEDLDGPRIKHQADRQAIDILRWLGLAWDEGPIRQRDDLGRYRAALDRLADRDLIYPCTCTRKEIEAAQSAPHGDEHELRYPGTCRPLDPRKIGSAAQRSGADACHTAEAWRLIVPDRAIDFHDHFVGPQSINVQQLVGDFIVWSKNGLPAYQLAVVVDDAAQQVTQVVRGDDLIRSAPRQRLLYELLKLAPVPEYTHLPLVLGEDGRRLAKRHGDTRLASYRDLGVRAERLVGLLAGWCGLGERREMSAAEFADIFDLDRLSPGAVTCTADDDAWLRDGKG